MLFLMKWFGFVISVFACKGAGVADTEALSFGVAYKRVG